MSGMPWSATECEVCHGSGELPIDVAEQDESDLRRFECWYCHGTGWYEAAT